MPAISCSAPGKVILCGEHAVVYGAPAIALPVFQVSTVTKIFAHPQDPTGTVQIIAPSISLNSPVDSLPELNPLKVAVDLVMKEFHIDHIPACEIRIQSTLPLAAGMGSSASVTISLVRAVSTFLGHPLDNEVVNRIGFEVEKLHHGSPSGIDNSVITYTMPVFFQQGKPIEYLKIASPFTLIIADSGKKGSTAEAVAGVRQWRQMNQPHFNAWLEEIRKITLQIKESLEIGNLEAVGLNLTLNHELLKASGVSNSELDALVTTALKSGAAGAKLSGGGLGGNIIALVNKEQAPAVVQSLLACGAVKTIITDIPASSGNQAKK